MGKTQGGVRRSLHVFGALERGGAETWLLETLRRRRDSDWTADICLLAGSEGPCVAEARALGVRVLHCPWRPAATFPARLFRLLRRERYDAVHAHVLLFSGAVASIAARAGVPLRAAHAHNSSDGRTDGAARRLYRSAMRRMIAAQANLVLACAPEAARVFDCASAKILPYGVDLSRFGEPPPGIRAGFGIPAEARVLGAVGRLSKQKNHGFLLRALAASPDQRLHLVIAGEGELQPDLEREIAARNLTGRVRLLGLRDDVPELLTGLCDAFVMPSRYEGLPVALLEAQAAGLPCLVSSAVSPHAVVCAEQVESLPLIPELWAQKMALAARRPRLSHEDAVRRMRTAGFDIDGAWERLTALYDAALGQERRALAA